VLADLRLCLVFWCLNIEYGLKSSPEGVTCVLIFFFGEPLAVSFLRFRVTIPNGDLDRRMIWRDSVKPIMNHLGGGAWLVILGVDLGRCAGLRLWDDGGRV
jgi:hypothetical protein